MKVFTLGRDLSVEQIDEIMQMGKKHRVPISRSTQLRPSPHETEIDG